MRMPSSPSSAAAAAAAAAHLAAGPASKAVALGKQRPGDDHASNQSVSGKTATDTQIFTMDTKGYIVLPGLLSFDECEAIKAHLYAGGDSYSGPCQALLDHPALVCVLNEFLVERDLSDSFYNFRCESSFVSIRKGGCAMPLRTSRTLPPPPPSQAHTPTPAHTKHRIAIEWPGLVDHHLLAPSLFPHRNTCQSEREVAGCSR